LTEIYRCRAGSYHETEDGNAPGQLIAQRWSAALEACVSQVKAAAVFAAGVAEHGREAQRMALAEPRVLSHFRAIAEFARVAGRIGAAVRCHEVWMRPEQHGELLGLVDEVAAQYSMAASTLLAGLGEGEGEGEGADRALGQSQLPLPGELCVPAGEEWRALEAAYLSSPALAAEAAGAAAGEAFPGEEEVCALTLHRLLPASTQPAAAANAEPSPPLHERVLEWRERRYFAPCANLLANTSSLQNPLAS
jgi:hypothetical protein